MNKAKLTFTLQDLIDSDACEEGYNRLIAKLTGKELRDLETDACECNICGNGETGCGVQHYAYHNLDMDEERHIQCVIDSDLDDALWVLSHVIYSADALMKFTVKGMTFLKEAGDEDWIAPHCDTILDFCVKKDVDAIKAWHSQIRPWNNVRDSFGVTKPSASSSYAWAWLAHTHPQGYNPFTSSPQMFTRTTRLVGWLGNKAARRILVDVCKQGEEQ